MEQEHSESHVKLHEPGQEQNESHVKQQEEMKDGSIQEQEQEQLEVYCTGVPVASDANRWQRQLSKWGVEGVVSVKKLHGQRFAKVTLKVIS